MRLTTTTNVTVDGVMQGLGGPDEDRSGGFERGGWVIPLTDQESGDYIDQIYGDATAFRSGRRSRPGQLADHFPGHHHPDLSACRASGVRTVHGSAFNSAP